MSRLRRNLIPGLPAHVVHRGNDRQAIFHCDGDRLFLRRCLADAVARFHIQLHAYVFMTNHVHLLMTPPEADSISRAMQSAARRYVGYFNARYARSGTLWEGRFSASVMGSDAYLFACHRYIDMNPVRAGIAAGPADYRWSSHRHYAAGDPDDLVMAHPVIVALGHDAHGRHLAYRGLFDHPESALEVDAIRAATRARRRLGGGTDAPKPPGRPRKKGV